MSASVCTFVLFSFKWKENHQFPSICVIDCDSVIQELLPINWRFNVFLFRKIKNRWNWSSWGRESPFLHYKWKHVQKILNKMMIIFHLRALPTCIGKTLRQPAAEFFKIQFKMFQILFQTYENLANSIYTLKPTVCGKVVIFKKIKLN